MSTCGRFLSIALQHSCTARRTSQKAANARTRPIAAVRPPRHPIVRGWVSGHWSRCWRRRQIATVSVIQAVGAGDAWSGLRCWAPPTEGRGLWCAQCWRKVCARWAESFTNGRLYSRPSPQDQDALILALLHETSLRIAPPDRSAPGHCRS